MRVHQNGEGHLASHERQAWVGRYRASGLSLRQFAQRHGLKPTQLHYWVYQRPAGGKSGGAVVAPGFHEVTLSPALNGSRWALEVQWRQGAVARVAAGAEPSWVAAVLGQLRGLC